MSVIRLRTERDRLERVRGVSTRAICKVEAAIDMLEAHGVSPKLRLAKDRLEGIRLLLLAEYERAGPVRPYEEDV